MRLGYTDIERNIIWYEFVVSSCGAINKQFNGKITYAPFVSPALGQKFHVNQSLNK